VEAECARADDRHDLAADLYARAFEAAREQQNPAIEALAGELAGRYQLERGVRSAADSPEYPTRRTGNNSDAARKADTARSTQAFLRHSSPAPRQKARYLSETPWYQAISPTRASA